MARKRLNKKGGSDASMDDDGNGGAGADYLSESHTIVTWNSGVNTNNADDGLGNADDGSWDIDDDYVAANEGPSDQQLQASEQRHAKLVEALSTLEDFASEKRTAKREGLLKLWFKALTQYASMSLSSQFIWEQRDGIVQACKQGIRSGSPSEQYAACRVLESLSILIADEGLYTELQLFLSRIISSHHRAVPVRVAALRALGMIVYMGVDDDQITEATLDYCEALAQAEHRNHPVPSTIRATAFQVWTVLATTIHDLYVAGKDDMSTGRGLLLLPLILQCLEQSDDPALRVAAGESVTYIHSTRLALGSMGVDESHKSTSTATNTTQRQYQQGSWEGSEWEDTIAEIEQVIHELSNQSGHYMSKKAKKEQRSYFRDYLATLQDNEDPEEVIQFRGGTLELTSWKDIVVLQFVRRCLQGGFQFQLLTNPTLQAVFGLALQYSDAGGMSQIEKRLYMSKTSEAAKLKDIDLTKKRAKRRNIKNHFLTSDGDDI